MQMARKRREPDYAIRGVYVDRVNCWVRALDSLGRQIIFYMVREGEDIDSLADRVRAELDRKDPIPDGATLPLLRHLKLI